MNTLIELLQTETVVKAAEKMTSGDYGIMGIIIAILFILIVGLAVWVGVFVTRREKENKAEREVWRTTWVNVADKMTLIANNAVARYEDIYKQGNSTAIDLYKQGVQNAKDAGNLWQGTAKEQTDSNNRLASAIERKLNI